MCFSLFQLILSWDVTAFVSVEGHWLAFALHCGKFQAIWLETLMWCRAGSRKWESSVLMSCQSWTRNASTRWQCVCQQWNVWSGHDGSLYKYNEKCKLVCFVNCVRCIEARGEICKSYGMLTPCWCWCWCYLAPQQWITHWRLTGPLALAWL